MRMISVLVWLVLAGACAVPAPSVDEPVAGPTMKVELQDLGPAPEITNEIWLNTDRPLTIEALRGQVVLLEMWTFGCVNCQRVIPYLVSWHEKFCKEGLVIIGNHYPEFSYEQDLANLQDAVERYGIPYPVAQDNQGRTWRAYKNRYWPTLYLIDKRGQLRYVHIGEGRYEETEAAISQLMDEPGI